MNRLVRLTWLLAIVTISYANAQAQKPQLFFTDILSGPNSGGENGNGAYVTLYGNGFGATQGSSTVSLNGSSGALRIVSWGTSWRWYQKIVVQLLNTASTGNFVVTVNGQSSSGLPFTVRTGRIFSVATSGSDSNSGSFSAPWKTIPKAVHTMGAGDITYVGDGVSQESQDNYNACIAVTDGGGTASMPIALVAYPGATVTIDQGGACAMSLRTPSVSGAMDYWTIAGLNLYRTVDLAAGPKGWRVIGNSISNPVGQGQSATFHTDSVTQLTFNGNYVHDSGTTAGSIDKFYHAVYFTTNSNSIFMAWNEVFPNTTHSTTSGGCRAVQFYSTGGSDQFDLHVHDNVIHDSICDGLNFATINPNNGIVEAYNNVIYHVGTGPDPGNGASNYSCITVGSSGSPSQAADIYNNTMYDCGSRGVSEGDAGALAIFGVPVKLRNNIVQQVSGEGYLTNSTSSFCSSFSGSNNIWFGLGNGPCGSQLTGNINSNPLFVSLGTGNFQLQSSSPGVDGGVAVSGLKSDITGNDRPQGSAFDIGAYELGSAAVARPNPPTNLQVVVH